MRDLFVSEARFIHNMLLRDGVESVQIPDQVLMEYHAPPRAAGASAFNADFILQFIATDDLQDFRSFSCPVRPNTMGAELSVDRQTNTPLCAELVAGEAFGREYFIDEIERLERELLPSGINVSSEQSKYARVLVLKDELCFLIFPHDIEPTMRGERVTLVDTTESLIVGQMADDKLVCLDGWIKTEVEDSDWFLVAEPDDE